MDLDLMITQKFSGPSTFHNKTCVVFPTQVLLWNVDGPEDINEDSLALFTILDPKIDVLIIGFGDNTSQTGKRSFPVDTSIILKMRRKGINVELLTTENA